jgi:tRNA1(Val) A37 N6-methylase TrmN6
MNEKIIETTLQRGRVKLLQPEKGFHASLDTVFLSAAVQAKPGDQILDVGCGVGSAGFCVLARTEKTQLTGIDIQQELIDLAHQGARLNGFENRAKFFCADLKHNNFVEDNKFDHVIMNPPYQKEGTHTPSPHPIKAMAHGEDLSDTELKDWIKYAHRKLKQGKHLTLIHRTDRLDELITVLTARRWFGSLVIYPLFSRIGDDSKRVIVQARKERYAPLKLMSGMIIHEKDGGYSKPALDVLEKSAAIKL